jgi:hypothetical protein
MIKRRQHSPQAKSCGIVMPFDLCTAPAIFEQLMKAVSWDLTKSCLVYLDNVAVVGQHPRNSMTIYRKYTEDSKGPTSSLT